MPQVLLPPMSTTHFTRKLLDKQIVPFHSPHVINLLEADCFLELSDAILQTNGIIS